MHTHTYPNDNSKQPTKEKAQNNKNVLIFMLSLNDSGILLSCITAFNRLLFCLIECVLCFTEASQFLEIPCIYCRSQYLCYWGYI